jgi:hypothetical protein
MTFGWLVRVVKLEVAGENGDYIVQRLDKGVVAQRLSRVRRDGEKKWGRLTTWQGKKKGGVWRVPRRAQGGQQLRGSSRNGR